MIDPEKLRERAHYWLVLDEEMTVGQFTRAWNDIGFYVTGVDVLVPLKAIKWLGPEIPEPPRS